MSLMLPAPRLASSIRTVRGGDASYWAFPSLAHMGTQLGLVFKKGNHNHLPPQAIRFTSRPLPFVSAWSADVEVMSYDSDLHRSPADPDLVVAPNGDLIVTTTFVNDGGSAYRRPHLARSTDGGVTWSAHAEILSRFGAWDTPCGACVVGSRLWLAHYGGEEGDSTGYRAGLTYSDDSGVTWSLGAEVANGGSTGLEFEEPGIGVLPDGRIVMALRTDGRAQIFLTHATTPGGTWRLPTAVARGYGKAAFAVMPDGTMLFCQRAPANGSGGQPAAFYTLRLSSSGIVRGSRTAYLDPSCDQETDRAHMYGDAEPLDESTAVVVWAGARGNHYTGGADILEAEVSIA